MADVFLSYAAEDRARASVMARTLRDAGYSVWWDRDIHGGADFAQVIARELSNARAVVVLWSASSVTSEWVRDEAAHARDDGKLLPVCIDDTLPPLGFRQRQAILLANWQGDRNDPAFQRMLDSINVLTGDRPAAITAQAPVYAPPPATALPSQGATRRTWPWVALGVVALALVAFLIGRQFFASSRFVPDSVAVMPFQPVGSHAAELAAGMTDAVTSKLTEKAIELLPAARAEFRLGGSAGSVDDDRYIDLTLSDAEGSPLWSRRLLPKHQRATMFQEYASRRATWALSCALHKRRRANEPVTNETFARLVGMCDHYMAEEYSEYFAAAEQFLKLAPNLSLAHAEMANSALVAIAQAQSQATRASLQPLCRAEAEAALRLDPSDPWAHSILSSAECGVEDVKEQEAHLRRAMATSYEFSPAWPWMISRLRATGRLDEAADLAREASARFPESDFIPEMYATLLAAQGQWLDAARWFDRARNMRPPDYRGTAEVASAALYAEPAVAKSVLERLVQIGQIDSAAAACWGQFIEARAARSTNAAATVAGCTRDDFATSVARMRMRAAMGDVDGAYAEAGEHLPDGAWRRAVALFYPEMNAFRRDARFWPLAARLGLVDLYLQLGQWPDFCTEADLPYRCEDAAKAARQP